MIVLSDEYHASYTVNIHRVFPSLRRQTLEMHHHCLVAKLSGCAPLGEFNLTEAILKADFCFQINLTGSAQFRTSRKILWKFEIGAPKMRNRIRISISNFARERTCRQTMSSYKTQISTCEIDFV